MVRFDAYIAYWRPWLKSRFKVSRFESTFRESHRLLKAWGRLRNLSVAQRCSSAQAQLILWCRRGPFTCLILFQACVTGHATIILLEHTPCLPVLLRVSRGSWRHRRRTNRSARNVTSDIATSVENTRPFGPVHRSRRQAPRTLARDSSRCPSAGDLDQYRQS